MTWNDKAIIVETHKVSFSDNVLAIVDVALLKDSFGLIRGGAVKSTFETTNSKTQAAAVRCGKIQMP